MKSISTIDLDKMRNIKYTVFPRIVCARSINFTVCIMCGQFEGVLYSRARSIRGNTVCTNISFFIDPDKRNIRYINVSFRGRGLIG